MIINVTTEHILSGVRGDCNACPIALAVSDAGLEDVVVNGDIEWTDPLTGDFKIEGMNSEACDFMYNFDSKMNVMPFSFELEKA